MAKLHSEVAVDLGNLPNVGLFTACVGVSISTVQTCTIHPIVVNVCLCVRDRFDRGRVNGKTNGTSVVDAKRVTVNDTRFKDQLLWLTCGGVVGLLTNKLFRFFRQREEERCRQGVSGRVCRVVMVRNAWYSRLYFVNRWLPIIIHPNVLHCSFRQFVAWACRFVRVFPNNLCDVVVSAPVIRVGPLPRAAVVPITAPNKRCDLVNDRNVRVMSATSNTLRTLTIAMSTGVIMR